MLRQFSSQPPADKADTKLKSFLPARRAVIDRVFGDVESYEQVEAKLEQAAKDATDEGERKWLIDTQKQLSTKSPTSLLV